MIINKIEKNNFNIDTLALRWNSNEMWLLDQTELPHFEKWIQIQSTEQMIEAIKQLRVRGAPLIGVAAVLFMALRANKGDDLSKLVSDGLAIRAARPTAVNLMVCIDRVIQQLNKIVNNKQSHMASSESLDQIVFDEAIKIYFEDIDLCEKISNNGQVFINQNDNIITHCNTGSLATVGVGTALGVINKAHQLGKKIHVYVDETRPLLQGGRLTAWELEKLEIPYTLITDSMAAFLMKQNKIQLGIVGCDRIALNGDFANKIGTYSLAVNCHFHNVPFYVAGPYTTIDFECHSGDDIPIEERVNTEVQGFQNSHNKIIWAPKNSKVYNPSFDVTPANLVSSWILDSKAYSQNQLSELKNKV